MHHPESGIERSWRRNSKRLQTLQSVEFSDHVTLKRRSIASSEVALRTGNSIPARLIVMAGGIVCGC